MLEVFFVLGFIVFDADQDGHSEKQKGNSSNYGQVVLDISQDE